MSSALLQLELLVKDRLEAIPFFDELPVLVDPRKNIVASIQANIAKLKTLIAPKVIGADDNHPNVHGVYFDDVRLIVGVFQNPTLKGDHPEPFEICEEIHKALKNWTPDGWSNAVNPVAPGIEQIADDKLNIFNNSFATKGGFVGALPQVATPALEEHMDLVDLTCATIGAAIFYTTDGTNPSPRNGTLYTEAIAIAGTMTIKARAFLAGYLNSELAKGTYTAA